MRFALHAVALLALLMIPSLAPAAPEDAAARFGGTWSGTYAGDAYGTLVLTLTPADDDKHTGSMRVTGDGGGYSAEFKTLTLEAGKMSATFDIPGGGGDVSLEGTFEGDTVTGTWSHRNPNGGSASGTWKASREPAQPK
jgi:hypothetical protein